MPKHVTCSRRCGSMLTAHQREVLVAIALSDVPIDVLAERLNTTRGALYETLPDARQKLRAALAARSLGVDGDYVELGAGPGGRRCPGAANARPPAGCSACCGDHDSLLALLLNHPEDGR